MSGEETPYDPEGGTITFDTVDKLTYCGQCKQNNQHFFADNAWFCKKCGFQNKNVEEIYGTLSTATTESETSNQMRAEPNQKLGASTYFSNSDYESGKKIKINTSKHHASVKIMHDLMRTASTDQERQIHWNLQLFYECWKIIGLDPHDDVTIYGKQRELQRLLYRLWKKSLQLGLQKGRNALANIIALFIISFRIQQIPYNIEDFITEFDNIFDDFAIQTNHTQSNDVKNSHSLMRQKVYRAERLIIEHMFSKPKCTWNKFTNQVEDSGGIHCARMNIPFIPPKNIKEEISSVMNELQVNEMEIPNFTLTLQSANQLFDNAEEKGLLSGLPPKTLAAALILLSMNKTSNTTAETMGKYAQIAKNNLKRACDKINDGLKLGIKIELF